MLRVIALDPGGTTGWQQYTEWEEMGANRIEWTGSQLGPEPHHEQLLALLESQHAGDYYVVCESFEFRQGQQRAGINLMPREYIGVTRLFGQQRPGVPVVFQTAAQAKMFVTDAKIKKMGLWVPGMRHQMDALRHLIYFLVNDLHKTELIRSWMNL